MIARAKLEVILGVLGPRFAGGPAEPVDPAVDPAPPTSITVERIAVVSVIGTLVARSGYLDAASGLVAYGDIGGAIASAMDDPSVRGVVLDVISRAARSAACSTWSTRYAPSRPAPTSPSGRSQTRVRCRQPMRSPVLRIGSTSRAPVRSVQSA